MFVIKYVYTNYPSFLACDYRWSVKTAVDSRQVSDSQSAMVKTRQVYRYSRAEQSTNKLLHTLRLRCCVTNLSVGSEKRRTVTAPGRMTAKINVCGVAKRTLQKFQINGGLGTERSGPIPISSPHTSWKLPPLAKTFV